VLWIALLAVGLLWASHLLSAMCERVQLFRRGRRTSAILSQSSSHASARGVFCGGIVFRYLEQQEADDFFCWPKMLQTVRTRARNDVVAAAVKRREHLATQLTTPPSD
jgi:hypothetical protein